jgi:periplasmic divalent cation tolerance protein
VSETGDSPYLVVFTTLGTLEEARTFVHELVRRKLVACGTIFPGAVSIYRWEGAVTEASESVVLLKTHRERWQDLEVATRSLHPYKVPELLGVPVAQGLETYLRWIGRETEMVQGDRGIQ